MIYYIQFSDELFVRAENKIFRSNLGNFNRKVRGFVILLGNRLRQENAVGDIDFSLIAKQNGISILEI